MKEQKINLIKSTIMLQYGSNKKFCEKHGIKPPNFSAWLHGNKYAISKKDQKVILDDLNISEDIVKEEG